MKKIIAINCLILLGHFPYISTRWMDLPYVPTTFYLEDFMGFGAMLMGPLLLINTLALILFHSKSSNWKKQSLHFSIFILLGLLLFSLYVAVLITVDWSCSLDRLHCLLDLLCRFSLASART